MRIPIPTIAFMLGLSYVTKYAGMDATLGVAFAATGHTPWQAPEAPAGETLVRNAVPRPRPLIGREDLLESIRNHMARPGATAVLVGPIGVGKSHLMREVAWQFSRDHELPVQFGGQPERISDGLFVVDAVSLTDRAELRALIANATRQGWRVIAESRVRLEEDGLPEILVNPLPVPLVTDSEEAQMANPSVRLLRSQASEGIEAEAARLAELARHLGGIPGVLRDFASRLSVRSASELVENIDRELGEYVKDSGPPGESMSAAVSTLRGELPEPVQRAFHALAMLDGASVELANRLAADFGAPDAWRLLERCGLLTIRGQGKNRRFRVLSPIAVAARKTLSAEEDDRTAAETWKSVGDWALEQSRQLVGPHQDMAFDRVERELTNLIHGIQWATPRDARLASYLVVGTWRTVGARGNPAAQAKILWRAARAGGLLLPPELGGEAFLGAAMALAIAGLPDLAEIAYTESLKVYGDASLREGYAWACLNYAADLLMTTDLPRAVEMLKESADQTSEEGNRHLALSHYSQALAMTGNVEGAIRVGEEVFAKQQLSTSSAARGRSYADLAQCYRSVGRQEAARPLLIQGAQLLRQAGIQDFLFDNLVLLAEIEVEAPVISSDRLESLVDEAAGIANRLGSNVKLLRLARLRMLWRAAQSNPEAFLLAVEDVFRFTQSVRAPAERELSLRQLADCLDKFGRRPYADAIRAALGDAIESEPHAGWKALMSSDSHATVCVLAVVLAKESLA